MCGKLSCFSALDAERIAGNPRWSEGRATPGEGIIRRINVRESTTGKQTLIPIAQPTFALRINTRV